MRKTLIAIIFLASSSLLAHESVSSAPLASGAISHAPLGVMGDHTHNAGEWMFSYRFMRMEMDGNLEGTQTRSASQITGTMMNPGPYMVAPRKMTMDMHMFGAMYAPNDKVTMMVMLPLLKNEMDHVTRMGTMFTTKSEGVGDAKVSALVNVYHSLDRRHRVHLNLGLSLPTGSIDERDDTPAMANALLPYPMQLGSGTYDLLPGITYRAYSSQYNWGAQLMVTRRLSENDNDYTLGERYELNAWLARSWSPSLSSSVRVKHSSWDNIDGRNPELNPMMVPTADPSAQGGDRSDIAIGANYLFTAGSLKGQRLALEYSVPFYQELDGPQMEAQWALNLGLQFIF
jgi:hypothetical protein